MQRRLVIAGLAATFAAPVAVIQPAAAAILFTCDSVTGSAVLSPGLVHDRRAQSLSSGPTAPAGPADITLASTSDAGVKGNGHERIRVAVGRRHQGRRSSRRATNLDPADHRQRGDVYVKDLTTGDSPWRPRPTPASRATATDDIAPRSRTMASRSPSSRSPPTSTLPTPDTDARRLREGPHHRRHQPGVDLRHRRQGQRLQRGTPRCRTTARGWLSRPVPPTSTPPTPTAHVRRLREGPDHRRHHPGLDLGHRGQGTTTHRATPCRCRPTAPRWPSCPLPPTSTPRTPTATDDVYVKDLITGDITLASTSDTGVKGNEAVTTRRSRPTAPRWRSPPSHATSTLRHRHRRGHLREGPHHRRHHARLDLRRAGSRATGQRASARTCRPTAPRWRSRPVPRTSTPPTTGLRRRLREGPRHRRHHARLHLRHRGQGANGNTSLPGSLSADGTQVAFVSRRHEPRPRRHRQPSATST